MGSVRYTQRAEEDLYEIADFTVRKWSVRQADRYISEMEDFCLLLAKAPGMGRACDELSAGLRRAEYKSHVVFFYPEGNGVKVSRVIHKSKALYGEEFEHSY